MAQDNPVCQRIARAMFEKLGHDVDVVADGEEAVAAAILRPYRAIFIDCDLPVLDGYLTTEEIRRLQGASDRTPIIAVTDSVTSPIERRCKQAGMDDVIAIPFDLETIDAALSRWPRRHSPSAVALDPAEIGVGDVAGSVRSTLDLTVLDQLQQLGESAGEDFIGRLATQFLADAECRIAELRQGLAGLTPTQ